MWAIHNSIKNWTFYNLSEHEVHLIVQTLTSNERRMTFLARQSDIHTSSEWIKLEENIFPKFYQAVAQDSASFEIYQNKSLEKSDEADCFVIRPSRKHQLRIHDRKEIPIQVIIEGQGQQFKSETIDVSEGGLYLKEIIPDWLSGYFIVKMTMNSLTYQLVCSLVEDQKIRQRIQIVSEENDRHYLDYKKWLNSI